MLNKGINMIKCKFCHFLRLTISYILKLDEQHKTDHCNSANIHLVPMNSWWTDTQKGIFNSAMLGIKEAIIIFHSKPT